MDLEIRRLGVDTLRLHKSASLSNILVDPARDRVWLMGFGVASRLPREHQSPEPPEFIAGTLSDMAPEQTGRMNRSIDSRSDLYSLGVTLLIDLALAPEQGLRNQQPVRAVLLGDWDSSMAELPSP